MCVKKRVILNPSYNPHDILSTKYIEVNCGHCWQCKLERSNGFSFRVFSEVLRDGVIPFFVTLTYSDKYLPKIVYVNEKRNYCEISCWNRQHVQRFHKRLRRYLHYYYGVPSSAFKYLSVCERGGNEEYIDDSGRLRVATERPHYHNEYILNVPAVPSPVRSLPSAFFDYCRYNVLAPDFVSFFKFLLNREWYYGNVDDIAFCRDTVAATRYVTNYLTKDNVEKVFNIRPENIYRFVDFDLAKRLESFYSRYSIRDFGKSIDCFNLDTISFKDLKGFPPAVKLSDLYPRSFCSVNLGMSFIKGMSESELFKYFSGLKKVSLPSVHSCSLINLPNYYFVKYCKRLKRLHENRYYSCNFLDSSSRSVVSGVKFTSPRVKASFTWDSWNKVHLSVNKSVYTELQTTDFGKKVQRYRIFRSVKKTCTEIVNYFRNPEIYRHLYDTYRDLDISFRTCVCDVGFDVIDKFSSLSLNGLFSRVLRLRSVPVELSDSLSESDYILFNLLNYLKLCRFTNNHLKHVAFEKAYTNKLGRTVFDNPDLFLNHYF